MPLLQSIVGPIRSSLAVIGNAVPQTPLNPTLLPLKKGQDAGSTVDADNLIFLTDSDEDIERKIRNVLYCAYLSENLPQAFVPPKFFFEKSVMINPCMDYFKHIVFQSFPSVDIERTEEFGGNLSYTDYATMEATYIEGLIDPKVQLGTLLSNLVDRT